jgi:hypothetical protein
MAVSAVETSGDSGGYDRSDMYSFIAQDDGQVGDVAAQPQSKQVWFEHEVTHRYGEVSFNHCRLCCGRSDEDLDSGFGEDANNAIRSCTATDHDDARNFTGSWDVEHWLESLQQDIDMCFRCTGGLGKELESFTVHAHSKGGNHPLLCD